MTRALIEADTEGIIRRWDAGAEALFGYAADQALGRPIDLIVPEPYRQAHWVGFRRAMEAPKVKDLAADLPVKCGDGQLRTFPGRLLILSDPLGTAMGAIAVFVDEGSTGTRPFE